MKIFLCTDMEGCSGVARWEDCTQQTPGWEYGRRMLTQDVKAAVEGFQAGGADRIVVSDGHGGGANLLMEDLPSGAEYICGRGGGSRALPFMDETFDAVGLIGQHAKAGTPDAFLPHTQSSVNWLGLWANGREIGELGQVALAAGHFDLPVIFVTGDRAVTIEAHDLLGEHVETVAVKEACSPTRGLCMALDDAHGAIREGAKRSLANIGKAKPLKTDLPMEVRIRFNATSHTEGPVRSGAELFDPLTTRRVVETQLEIYTV
jgi:D-amino peptidase